jgi:hypothetical protein
MEVGGGETALYIVKGLHFFDRGISREKKGLIPPEEYTETVKKN